MPLPPRCLVDELAGDSVRLPAAAQHHFERVLRLRRGEALELVDGRGALWHARWTGTAELEIVARQAPVPPPSPRVELAVALPRLPRLEWLVEKLSELGLARLHLLITQHGERELGPQKLMRLQRIADEALAQCRRLHRLAIEAPAPLSTVLARRADAQLWLASPPHAGTVCARLTVAQPAGAVLLLVGPEGGFDAAEEALSLAAGAQRIVLGDTILRVETAGLALVALAQAGLRPDR
ncbi:MAG: RsmE family RNA methyltransferase [Planctomycetota bacterium]